MKKRGCLIAVAIVMAVSGAACSDRASDEAKRNADAAVDAGKVAANKMAEVAKETGAAVSDGWITTKVKAKFADETLLKGSDITVDTKDHDVTLSGTAASAQAKVRAAQIASGTEGVRHVIDRLAIK
jgi:osmotically-inducible protein OsmY